jgi:hypothetical protein
MIGHMMLSALLMGFGAVDDGPETFESALTRAREAAETHRYTEVIETLSPFAGAADPEVRYTTTAEIGRAWYHLGAYLAANRALREAVAIHPDRVETALYLLATSHLIGDTEQALLVLGALLESGARDLYLAVTLAGKQRFLADPQVLRVLDEHAISLEVDVEAGSVMKVALGESRTEALAALGVASSPPTGRSLTAEAGPALVWAFLFDDDDRLFEIVLEVQNLVEYTPYRPQFSGGVDWQASPAAVISAWGPPVSSVPIGDGSVVMSWGFGRHSLAVEFAPPGALLPPDRTAGAAMMRLVRLRAHPGGSPARIEP